MNKRVNKQAGKVLDFSALVNHTQFFMLKRLSESQGERKVR